MCCVFTVLVFIGPRAGALLWWLVQPVRWQTAFQGWFWPLVGLVFVPWMTMMYVLVFPGGVTGWDWLWMGLGLLADIAWWAGGGFRRQVPGYAGQY